mgnify:CR=1 FL=1
MPHRKTRKRFEHPNELRFLPFSCYRRLQLFNRPAIRDRFVEHLGAVQQATRFELFAWVVMPEHVHLLIVPNLPDEPVSRVLEQLQGPFAKQVLARWRELDAPILQRLVDATGRHHFWQAGGGYDRNIFTSRESQEKFHYIHNNPVSRGLVDRAVDWRWSSARWYADGTDDWPVIMSPDWV